jgi:hypothetical protein
MLTWCYAKNRTSFHPQDVFHEDDDRAPHGLEFRLRPRGRPRTEARSRMSPFPFFLTQTRLTKEPILALRLGLGMR